ncbi:DUF642 domain-containing protein, partial [bacterium]|nr:DUF642 domain-containing protein [bacterium]
MAYHKASGSLLFFYEQTLYSWNTTTRELSQHKFKEGKTASAAIYGDSLWWIKSNSNQLYQLDISDLNNGTIISGSPTKYLLNKYTKAGFGDIAISSDGILYGSATGGQIKRGGFFSFDLQSIIDSGKTKINIENHGYKQCGKTEWEHSEKKIPIGMQLALSADEKVLYGQTHQNQSAKGLDTTGQYFVFRHKDSDGRFTSEIDYADYQQSHNQLDGVGFRDIGGAGLDAIEEAEAADILSFEGASGAETNGSDINRKLNPYLKYSVIFKKVLEREQKLIFINESKESRSGADISDTRLNETIEFKTGDKSLDQQFERNNNAITVPQGVKQFDMLIDVIDDEEVEGDESLILAIEGYPDLAPAKATIIDNDYECGENLLKNGDFEDIEQKGSRKWWSTKTIPGWELLNNDGEVWTSGFKGIQDNIDGNNFYLELDAKRKLNAISQTVTTEIGSAYTLSFDLHRRRANKNETVVVSLNDIGANSPTSGEWHTQSYSFIAESDQAIISFSEPKDENDSYGGLIDNISLVKNCTDNDFDDVDVVSFHAADSNGAELTDGFNTYLSYSLSFDEKLKKQQTLSFSQSLPVNQNNVDPNDVLLGADISFLSDNSDNDQDFSLNNGQLTIPKGVSSFEARIPIVDDKIVEGTESLTLSVAGFEATANITDN